MTVVAELRPLKCSCTRTMSKRQCLLAAKSVFARPPNETPDPPTSGFTRQKQQHGPLQNVDDVSRSMIPASAAFPQIPTFRESDSAKNAKTLINGVAPTGTRLLIVRNS